MGLRFLVYFLIHFVAIFLWNKKETQILRKSKFLLFMIYLLISVISEVVLEYRSKAQFIRRIRVGSSRRKLADIAEEIALNQR